MHLSKFNRIHDFINYNEEYLLKKESANNLMLGLSYRIKNQVVEVNDPLYYSIQNDNHLVIGSALRINSEKSLIITEMPKLAVDSLIADLIKRNTKIMSVVGEKHTTVYFRDQWHIKNDVKSKFSIDLGIYECTKVIFPSIQKEILIEATTRHKEILLQYVKRFFEECFPNTPKSFQDIEKVVETEIKRKTIFLLASQDGNILSMAAYISETLNGGTISLVYTPQEFRRKGLGSIMVALLTQKILKSGKKFVNLFTDLSNPTSNSIYQKIGFIKVSENIEFEFF